MPHLVGTYAEGAMKYECWLYALSYDTVCMYVCMYVCVLALLLVVMYPVRRQDC